jgi:hypothetical protein
MIRSPEKPSPRGKEEEMDIGKAFTFVFEDKDWVVKMLIAAGIVLGGVLLSFMVLPAIAAAVLLSGYGLEITRRVLRRDVEVLPAWDNWSQIITDGIQVWLISLVYALPIIIASVCLGVPMGILSEGSEEAASLVSLMLSCWSFLWAIPMGLALPVALARFAQSGQLSDAFRLGEIVAFVRDHLATYLITLVIAWVASFIGGIGILACGIGWLFTAPYASFLTSHLYGQAYLEASDQGLAPAVEEEAV